MGSVEVGLKNDWLGDRDENSVSRAEAAVLPASQPNAEGIEGENEAMQQSLIGHTLLERYRIIERLGQGANGVVYKAQQLNLDRFVTLKVVEQSNRAGCERLRQEAFVLAQFHHPGIRQVYGVEQAGPYTFAVLDYAEQSLKTQIETRRQQRQVFTRTETVQLLRPVAQVLDYLHDRNWAHMDVKPENILLSADGRVLLADFGVAQPFGKPQSRGTPTHVAPEVVNGQEVTAATDLYSLAVVAFEMLSGRLPFLGDTQVTLYRHHAQTQPPMLDRLSARTSNSVAWVVNRALSKEPQKRYPRANVFLDTLERADTISVRLPTLPRRRPIPLAVTAASVVCASVLIIGLDRQPRSGPTPTAITTAPAANEGKAATEPTAARTEGDSVAVLPATEPPTVAVKPTSTQAPTPTAAPTYTIAPPVTPTPAPAVAACRNAESDPGAIVVSPAANAQLPSGKVTIRGTASLPNSIGYEFQYRSEDRDPPDGFHFIDGSTRMERIANGELGVWDTSHPALPPGRYIFKLRVKLNNGQHKDCDVPVLLK